LVQNGREKEGREEREQRRKQESMLKRAVMYIGRYEDWSGGRRGEANLHFWGKEGREGEKETRNAAEGSAWVDR
jgi:hypothetical protein